jgi:hypothetical protein
MRAAKLFTLAAAGFAVLGLLVKAKPSNAAVDVFVRDGYFVLSNETFIRLAVVICGVFALLYFASGRWLRTALNTGLSLANFGLIVFPLALVTWSLSGLNPLFGPGQESRLQTFMLFYIVIPTIGFLLGCLLFVVNFCWTVIRGLRAPS